MAGCWGPKTLLAELEQGYVSLASPAAPRLSLPSGKKLPRMRLR